MELRTWTNPLASSALCFFALLSALSAQGTAPALLKQTQADVAAGRYAVAAKEGAEAAAQFRRDGDQSGEGRALTQAGLAHLYSGDYQSALRDFTAALALARLSNDGDGEVTRINNIGTTFYYQGHYSEAMDRYQEALRRVESGANESWAASRRQLTVANIAILYQTVGQFERALDLYTGLLHSPQALPLAEQAQLLANVGTLRRRLGDPRKALETYVAAQSMYKKAAHRDGEIAVLNNIGIVQAMDLNDPRSAAAAFTEALRLADASKDRPLAVHARLYRGEAFFRAGLLDLSADDFQVAATEAEALGEREESWKAQYGLARISASHGDNARTRQLLDRAIQTIESIRSGLGATSLKSDFLADKRDVYDMQIDRSPLPDDVFRLMEQSRARNLRDRLNTGSIVDLRSFASRLPPGTLVLEYWLGNSTAAVLWVSASAIGMKRVALSAQDLDLASILSDPKRQDWRVASQAVSNKLLSGIAPLGDHGVHHVIVVPDGALARIPFEALMLDGRPLIERVTVSYSQSANLIDTTIKRRSIQWPWEARFEGFADPRPGPTSAGVELGRSRVWQPLPEAAREVKGIAGILGGRSRAHIGADARKEFLNRPQMSPVLHFATHAFADTQTPDRSYILLAPSGPSQRFDYLFLGEIDSLALEGVDLATLSACQTDAGKFVRGEGVESFSRAFLAAGARSVVTSLWNVGDRSTAEMMLEFYSRLAHGDSKAEALREAKREFLRHPVVAHPAYWAAFVLNGDSNSGLRPMISWGWFVVPVAAVLACLFLLFRTRLKKA